jgi:RimJ/RimL family protein N-acetyltransferase
MFDIVINFEDINISSIEKEDIGYIQKWINLQETYEEKMMSKPLDIDEFYQRFLEYYMSESEFFLKILKENKLIGIFKGRIEFKSTNEVIIWCFILDNVYRGSGLGSKILSRLLEYFKVNLGIEHFSTGIVDGNSKVMKFWNRNKFDFHRRSKSYFDFDGEKKDMLLLKRCD